MFSSSTSISLSFSGEAPEQRKIHKCIKANIARKANSVAATHAGLLMSNTLSGEEVV